MAKDKISDYSATAASNTDVGGVGIQGTNAISNADDAFREIMSHLAETNAGTSPWADTMTIGDAADLTKEFRFEASGITAANTRVLTVPNFDGTIATLAGTETLSNKTLTSPTINTPTITAADFSTTIALTGDITPAQIGATQNDYAPTGIATASVLRVSSDANNRQINGITTGADGRILIIHNVGSFSIYLADEQAGSTAANRILTPGSAWLLMNPGTTAILVYDATSSRWRAMLGALEGTSQTVQEAGTDNARYVTPFYQHNHSSAAKCWGSTTGAGTPVLGTAYNVTSIADTATGRLTVTIATDFSSADWTGAASVTVTASAERRLCTIMSKAAGTVILESLDGSTLTDPGVGYNWTFFGDQ